MAKPKAKAKCRVPGCTGPDRTRGLCGKHYYQLMYSKDAKVRADIEKRALPPTRQGGRRDRGRKPPSVDDVLDKAADPGPAAAPVRFDASEALDAHRRRLTAARARAGRIEPDDPRPSAVRAAADEKIGLVCEFATAVGILRVPFQGGQMFYRDAWGDRVLFLGADATLRFRRVSSDH